MNTETALDEFERDALLLVSRAAMQIRMLARDLPPSAARDRIRALAEGMHNIPSILGGSDMERQRHGDLVAAGVAELHRAMGVGPRAFHGVAHEHRKTWKNRERMLSDICFDFRDATGGEADTGAAIETALADFVVGLDSYSGAPFDYPSKVITALRDSIALYRDQKISLWTLRSVVGSIGTYYDNPTPPPVEAVLTHVREILSSAK